MLELETITYIKKVKMTKQEKIDKVKNSISKIEEVINDLDSVNKELKDPFLEVSIIQKLKTFTSDNSDLLQENGYSLKSVLNKI
jgi:hypothetical protein